MRLVLMSDTHGQTGFEVPEGDVLIHAGDLTEAGHKSEAKASLDWLRSFRHPYKIITPGNHDHWAERSDEETLKALTKGVSFLVDSGVRIRGTYFYGAPWQPEILPFQRLLRDWSFNLPRGKAMREKWEKIPGDVDVLITHGPPKGTGDTFRGVHVGCSELDKRARAIQPKLHVFGHVHDGYGAYSNDGSLLVNAASTDYHGNPVNPVITVDISAAGAGLVTGSQKRLSAAGSKGKAA